MERAAKSVKMTPSAMTQGGSMTTVARSMSASPGEVAGDAGGEREDGDLGIDAQRGGEQRAIGDEKVLHLVRLAGGLAHAAPRIGAHAAGALRMAAVRVQLLRRAMVGALRQSFADAARLPHGWNHQRPGRVAAVREVTHDHL